MSSAIALLEKNLAAWEGEECSVQAEHSSLIREIKEFLASYYEELEAMSRMHVQ